MFVLIDAEVGIGEMDENCIKMASYSQIEFNVVFTKIDKLKKKEDLIERIERCKSIITKYSHFSPFIFLTSTK
jgi:GTP-binding protein EngB required for normal cell division